VGRARDACARDARGLLTALRPFRAAAEPILKEVTKSMLPGSCVEARLPIYIGDGWEAPRIDEFLVVPMPRCTTEDVFLRGFVDLNPTPGGRITEYPLVVIRAPPPRPGDSLDSCITARWHEFDVVEVNGVPQPMAYVKAAQKGCSFEEFLCARPAQCPWTPSRFWRGSAALALTRCHAPAAARPHAAAHPHAAARPHAPMRPCSPRPRLPLTASALSLGRAPRSLVNNVTVDPSITRLSPTHIFLKLIHKQTRTVGSRSIVQWRAGRRWRLREDNGDGRTLLMPTNLAKYTNHFVDLSRKPCAAATARTQLARRPARTLARRATRADAHNPTLAVGTSARAARSSVTRRRSLGSSHRRRRRRRCPR